MYRNWKRSQYVSDDADYNEEYSIIVPSETGVMTEFRPLNFETEDKKADTFKADVVQNWHCRIIKTIESSTHLYMRNEEGIFMTREIVLSNEELLKIKGYSTIKESQFRMVIEASQLIDGKREVRKRIERIRTNKLQQDDIKRILEEHMEVLSFLKEDSDGNQ